MKEPLVTDAEFEVVRDAPARPQFNGLGLPPEWEGWGPARKVFYIAGMAVCGVAVALAARWLADAIGLPSHW